MLKIRDYELFPKPSIPKKYFKNIDLCVIGGWETPPYIFALLYSYFKKIPKILFYESTLASHRFNGFLIRYIRRKIFGLADLVVTAGSASTEAVLEMGVKSERILTLFNPVNVESFAKSAISRPSYPSEGHRFMYVGQLIERKNIEALIEAFGIIRKEKDTLTIVGDGPLRKVLQEFITTKNLQENVILKEGCPPEEISKEYAEADTLVLPSKKEVWGLVVNEALASGLHAVVSNTAGVAEFAKNMKGVYLSGTDTQSIAAAMSKSREQWTGPIHNPEILGYTPGEYVNQLIRHLIAIRSRN
jgi:glycosyltransferase involved in cell wall biosynthesis